MKLPNRIRDLPRIPNWAHATIAVVIIAVHALTMPVEFSFVSDIFLEGVYLVLVVLLALLVYQLDSPALELGWMVFVHARLVDFLDELFAEPNPLVNPYLGGGLTILGLGILVVGIRSVIEERRERLAVVEQQAEQLALLNRIVRHDIRNQCAVASGWAETLREHVDDEHEEHIDRIQQANESTVALTETARDIVDLLEQEDDAALKPRSLGDVVEETIDTRGVLYADANIAVEGIPDVTVASDELLNSLFRNLLDNAVQHTDRDEPSVTVTGERRDGSVAVTIADDGPGLSDEEAAILEEGPALEHPSEGMGLYFIRSLVDRYGGDITVTDNEPRGTRITVVLPVASGD